LIVDPNPETRGVLRTLVERLGAEGVEAPSPSVAERLAAADPPDLLVIDADSPGLAAPGGTASLWDWAARSGVPVVVLGTKRSPIGVVAGEFLRKPYHFGALAHRIRGTLATRRAA
jgi:DNA-binding response OmpR family regulator